MPTREKYATMTKYKGGGAVKGRSMASRKKGREYTKLDYEKDKFKSVAKTMGQLLLTVPKTLTEGLAGGVKQVNKAAKEVQTEFPKVGSRKRTAKEVKGYNGGGEVKGGTSSQISGRHYKGVF